MANPPSAPRLRYPKGKKRDWTRQQLIEAASQIIGEKGVERTSLEEVAARAGMTRGAIYGNFKNKEELFIAVAETRWKPIIPPLPAKKGSTLKDRMRAVGQAVLAAIPERRAQAVGATSFLAYALTHEDLRTLVVRKNSEIYKSASKFLSQIIPEEKLPMPAEHFVRVVHALTDGLLMLRFLTPELIPDAVILEAFEALAGRK
ncbi:MAG TPA: TetR family transcriptional regulator [Candidatus Angelobacter sp.]